MLLVTTSGMDARYWWITDLQESGLIKVSFAPTKDDSSDVGTKNVTGEVFDRIRPKLVIERPKEVQMACARSKLQETS